MQNRNEKDKFLLTYKAMRNVQSVPMSMFEPDTNQPAIAGRVAVERAA